MKIGIFGFGNLRFMPYLNFYLDCIDLDEHEVHVIYWDRKLIEEPYKKNIIYHKLSIPMVDQLSKFKKVKDFIKYKKFATKIIQEEQFDFIITMHTFPAVLLRNKLNSEYKDRFIFDYRDYTYEKFNFFKKEIQKLVLNSRCTFISSDAFRMYMPEQCANKIYTSHNLRLVDLKHQETFEKQNGILRIAYWGFIRELDSNMQLISYLGKDKRFELHFYGKDNGIVSQLKQRVDEIGANNVYFHGEYLQDERYEFGCECDIVHNLYIDQQMKNAVSNKYYDALIFGKPQLCAKGMYMGDLVEQKKIGIALDLNNDNFANELYSYYESINKSEMNEHINDELNRVVGEFKDGEAIIRNALRK